jgi:predicted TIM-barrel fold metal-dependent hydrolase
MNLRPDRMVWGSDWPYIRFIDQVAPNFNPLEFFMDAIQGADHRQRLFTDNAKILYQFD